MFVLNNSTKNEYNYQQNSVIFHSPTTQAGRIKTDAACTCKKGILQLFVKKTISGRQTSFQLVTVINSLFSNKKNSFLR